jgi:hypothetical protein
VSDRWALADLRATAIMDATRTGAVAERNGRTLAEAVSLSAAKTGLAAPTCGHDRDPARKHVDDRACGHVDMPAAPPDGWLPRLMACDGWSDRKRRLSPEEQLSALVATEMRRLTLAGELRAVWTCHRVEHAGGDAIGRMIQRLQRVLGVVPGAPDYWFAWGTGAGLLELKVERPADLLDLRQDGTARAPTRTYLRPVQKDFREWAVSNGVKHACCRSVPEVLVTLREWGRL